MRRTRTTALSTAKTHPLHRVGLGTSESGIILTGGVGALILCGFAMLTSRLIITLLVFGSVALNERQADGVTLRVAEPQLRQTWAGRLKTTLAPVNPAVAYAPRVVCLARVSPRVPSVRRVVLPPVQPVLQPQQLRLPPPGLVLAI